MRQACRLMVLTMLLLPNVAWTETGAPPPPLFSDDFESGTLDASWTISGTGRGMAVLARRPDGSQRVVLQPVSSGWYALTEITRRVENPEGAGLVLSFDVEGFHDDLHPMPPGFSGHSSSDGVAVSLDGLHWVRVVDLSNYGHSQETRVVVDLTAALADAGMTGTAHFYLRFQQYDNFSAPSDGLAFDNVRVEIGRCGDGIAQAAMGETCDDGNLLAGDGCGLNCLLETGNCRLGETGSWGVGPAYGIEIANGIAYVAFGQRGIGALELGASPPRLISSVDTQGNANDLALDFPTVWVADRSGGLLAVDISDLANLHIVSALPVTGNPWKIKIENGLAYVITENDYLAIVDVTIPSLPMELGRLEIRGDLHDLQISGDHVYIAGGWTGFSLVDASDPRAPVLIAVMDTPGDLYALDIGDGIAYLGDGFDGLVVTDISSPFKPFEISSIPISGGNRPSYIRTLTVSGYRAYIGNLGRGPAVVDISNPHAPLELSHGERTASDMQVSEGILYVAEATDGVSGYDLSVPDRPPRVVEYKPGDSARSIVLGNGVTYLGDGDRGVEVVDTASLSLRKNLATRSPVRHVALLPGLLLVSEDGGWLEWFDIADPVNPVRLGELHLGRVVKGMDAYGDHVYLATDFRGVAILDFSNPSAPNRLPDLDVGGQALDVFIHGKVMLVAGGQQGACLYDLSNSSAPEQMLHLDMDGGVNGGTVVDGHAYLTGNHIGLTVISLATGDRWESSADLGLNVRVREGKAYVLHGNDGLSVWDVSTPLAPEKIGEYANAGTLYDFALDGTSVIAAHGSYGMTVLGPLPGTCAPVCGNGGEPEYGEVCDDGNLADGDGCNAECSGP